jgi:hypothetical protein
MVRATPARDSRSPRLQAPPSRRLAGDGARTPVEDRARAGPGSTGPPIHLAGPSRMVDAQRRSPRPWAWQRCETGTDGRVQRRSASLRSPGYWHMGSLVSYLRDRCRPVDRRDSPEGVNPPTGERTLFPNAMACSGPWASDRLRRLVKVAVPAVTAVSQPCPRPKEAGRRTATSSTPKIRSRSARPPAAVRGGGRAPAG